MIINNNGKKRSEVRANKRKLVSTGPRAIEGKNRKDVVKTDKNMDDLECHFSMPGKIEIGG